MLEILRSFCEGTAIGAAGVVIAKKYDEAIKDLPIAVRVIAMIFIMTGCTSIGIKMLDHYRTEEE